MRTLAALTAAILTCSALAQPGSTPPAPPKPVTPSQPATATPATPPPAIAPAGPQPGEVPSGPVISKSEVDGILIEELKIGTGYEVKPGGAVVAMYHGTLKDGGKIFDSTYDATIPHPHPEPAAFTLDRVIPGWQKGVPGMKIGGIRRLTIPAALAYGAGGNQSVPPNSDLVFVIELKDALQIEDQKAGTGEELSAPFIASIACTMTDDQGKVVEKADAAKPLLFMSGEHQGLQIGMEGMKVGGKRKITIPKGFNRFNQSCAPDMQQDTPVTVEVELLNARNLRPKTPAAPAPTTAK
jgi:FKBP-type peptidyl-prolyl cis-trans isomerase